MTMINLSYTFISNGIMQTKTQWVNGNTSLVDTTDSNTLINVSSIGMSNGSVTINIPLPTAAQQAGDFYLSANGSWVEDSGRIIYTAPNTASHVVDSWNSNTFQSAIYDTSIYCGANVKASRVSLAHNGSATSLAETVGTTMGGAVGTFSAAYANGVVSMSFTASTANTKVTLSRTQFPV